MNVFNGPVDDDSRRVVISRYEVEKEYDARELAELEKAVLGGGGIGRKGKLVKKDVTDDLEFFGERNERKSENEGRRVVRVQAWGESGSRFVKELEKVVKNPDMIL